MDPSKACKVRGRDVLNSCELAERGPAVIAFFATRSKRCARQIDVVERVRRRFPDVGFAAVSVRGDRADAAAARARRGWGMPVGHDHDGAVSNAYAVAICPTITFARRGGRVAGTSFEQLDEAELARRVQALR